MNTSWSTQTAVDLQRRKQTFRESDQNTRRVRNEQRLKEKGLNQETRDSLEKRVRQRILEEPDACDILTSLFSSSLFSYRRVSICDPFPYAFVVDGGKDFTTIESYTKAIPDVKHLTTHQSALSNLPPQILNLISWIIDTELVDGLTVKRVSLDQYKQDTSGIDSKQSKFSDPSYIFEVSYTQDHPHYEAWHHLAQKYGVTIGFHGSVFENFHSIVRNGLDSTYGKETSLFGEGIYLSEDRDVAYSFLKCGKNYYVNSIFGSQVGCIVCGEVIKHPKHVRISSEKETTGIRIGDDEAKLPKRLHCCGKQ